MKTKKLTLAVREQIIDDLESGLFNSGELPPIVKLAEKYNVSVQPVFHALHMLREENRIVQRQNGRFAKAGKDLSPVYSKLNNPSKTFLFLKVLTSGDSPGNKLAEFELRIFNHLTAIAKKRNYKTTYRIIKQSEEMPAVLKKGECAAVFVTRKISPRLAELLFALEIPVVNFDFESSRILPNNLSINTDNYQAGIYVAKEFFSKGCSSYLYIHAGTAKELVAPGRFRGFAAGLGDSGVPDDACLEIIGFPNKGVKTLVSTVKKNPAAGIFVSNDYLASIAYLKLLKAGLKVNKDFIICGFDDLSYSRDSEISTFTVNMDEIVNQAVAAIYDMRKGKRMPFSRLYIPADFIPRDSTAGNFL